MNCWQMFNSASRPMRMSVSSGTVDIVGEPLSHALPISITMLPFGLSSGLRSLTIWTIHSMYVDPLWFPYDFGEASGNGGEVNISWTFPLSSTANFEFRKSSIEDWYAAP